MNGFIQKRGSGNYRLIVNAGKDEKGKLIRYSKTVYVANKKLAEEEMNRFLADIHQKVQIQSATVANSDSSPSDDKITFEQFAAQWIEYSRGRLAAKTIYRYEEYLKSRINPVIGSMKLDEIKPMHLAELYVKLQNEPNKCKGRSGTLSNRTVLHHHRIIHSILQTAFMWDLVVSNVAAKVKPPKVIKPDIPVYTADDVTLMLAAVEKELLIKKVILWLAITTGARLGEIMGLKWTDFDSTKHTVYIQRSAQYFPGKGTTTKEPKTKSGKRLLALPDSIFIILEQWRSHCIENNLYDDHLFIQPNHKLMYSLQMTSWFPKFVKRHGLRHINFHGLRHTHITLAIAAGFPLKNISTRAGHSNIGITCDTYAVPVTAVDREIADSFEKFLGGS